MLLGLDSLLTSHCKVAPGVAWAGAEAELKAQAKLKLIGDEDPNAKEMETEFERMVRLCGTSVEAWGTFWICCVAQEK